jgi:hypothetical protein
MFESDLSVERGLLAGAGAVVPTEFAVERDPVSAATTLLVWFGVAVHSQDPALVATVVVSRIVACPWHVRRHPGYLPSSRTKLILVASPSGVACSPLLDQSIILLSGQIRVIDGRGVAGPGFDAQPEEVGQAADVALGGVGLVEDAILTHRCGGQSWSEGEPYPVFADWVGACGAVEVQEQIGVGCVWPSLGTVVKVSAKALADRLGEHDDTAAR